MSERQQFELPDPELLIVLDPPIKVEGGGMVTEVVLREPSAAQVRTAETFLRTGVNPLTLREYQISLMTSVSGLNRKVIDQLPVSKLVEGADYLQNFITPPLRTGSN